jgi:hypothetical protein
MLDTATVEAEALLLGLRKKAISLLEKIKRDAGAAHTGWPPRAVLLERCQKLAEDCDVLLVTVEAIDNREAESEGRKGDPAP